MPLLCKCDRSMYLRCKKYFRIGTFQTNINNSTKKNAHQWNKCAIYWQSCIHSTFQLFMLLPICTIVYFAQKRKQKEKKKHRKKIWKEPHPIMVMMCKQCVSFEKHFSNCNASQSIHDAQIHSEIWNRLNGSR